jgi:hypothetical protein
MEWGKDHKVIPQTLNQTEAHAFVDFMDIEWSRHQREMEWLNSEKKNCDMSNPYQRAFSLFLTSALERHQEDLDSIRPLKEWVRMYRL